MLSSEGFGSSDDGQVIAEYEDQDLDGDVDYLARKFIYGPGIDEPICMTTYAGGSEDGRYFYHGVYPRAGGGYPRLDGRLGE